MLVVGSKLSAYDGTIFLVNRIENSISLSLAADSSKGANVFSLAVWQFNNRMFLKNMSSQDQTCLGS